MGLDWLGNIGWGDKLVPDLILYLASLIAFAFLPAQLGRKLWLLLGWFVAINVVHLLGFWEILDWEMPWFYAALGVLPWLMVVLDLLFQGRLSGGIAAIPMRSLILWQTTRLMGIHFVLAIRGGWAPEEFALQVGFSEILTGMGALALWGWNRPDKAWFRTMLLFWNTYGLTSALAADWRMLFSNPNFPFKYSGEIFQYVTSHPQYWVYCYWIPIAICMHAAVFYKMYLNRGRELG